MKKKEKQNSKEKGEKMLQNILRKLKRFTHSKIILESAKIKSPKILKLHQKKKNLKNKFLLYFRNKNKNQIKKFLKKNIDKFLRTANRIIGDNENEEFIKDIEFSKVSNYIFQEITFDLKNLKNEKFLYNFKNINKKFGNGKPILEKDNNCVIFKFNDFDLNYAFWEYNLDKKKPKLIIDREIYIISKCINFLVELKNKILNFENDKLILTNDTFQNERLKNNDNIEGQKLKKRTLKIEIPNQKNLKKNKIFLLHKNSSKKKKIFEKEILTKNDKKKIIKNNDLQIIDNSEENNIFLKKLNFFYSYLDNRKG